MKSLPNDVESTAVPNPGQLQAGKLLILETVGGLSREYVIITFPIKSLRL